MRNSISVSNNARMPRMMRYEDAKVSSKESSRESSKVSSDLQLICGGVKWIYKSRTRNKFHALLPRRLLLPGASQTALA